VLVYGATVGVNPMSREEKSENVASNTAFELSDKVRKDVTCHAIPFSGLVAFRSFVIIVVG